LSARQYASRGIQIWRAEGVQLQIEEVHGPAVSCLCYEALSEWHIGEITSCDATMAEAIALAKELNNASALAVALFHAGFLWHLERNPTEVERLASELIELCLRQNFAIWLAGGTVLRGWARSASGDPAEGIARIEQGIRDFRAACTPTTSPSGGGSNVTARKFSADCDRASDRPTTVGGWDETYIRVKGK
jgi:hypothetical protein